MDEGEACFRTCQGHPGELLRNVLELHIVGLEELPPRRDVVEEVADSEIRPGRSRDLVCGKVNGSCKLDFAAHLVPRPPGLQCHFGNGGNGGEGLAPEAECGDVIEVLGRGNLGCSVSLEAQHSLVGSHSASVVYNLDQCSPGIGQDHRHLGGAGIHRVLHQLLDYGGRPLDDFARRYHIGNVAGQYANVHLTAGSRTW